MDEQELTAPGMGQRSIRDVVAHLTGWALIDTEIMRRLGRGERPLAEGEDYDIDARNASYAAEAASMTASAAIAELCATFDEFINAAAAVPEERFAEGRTAYRLMQGPRMSTSKNIGLK